MFLLLSTYIEHDGKVVDNVPSTCYQLGYHNSEYLLMRNITRSDNGEYVGINYMPLMPQR
jgi:hypothetical protein